MVALDDASVSLRLAGLDHLVLVVGDVELKAVLEVTREGGGGWGTTGQRMIDGSEVE